MKTFFDWEEEFQLRTNHRVLAVGGTITVATLWTTRSRSAHPSKIDGRQICVAKRLIVIICSESMLPGSLLQWFKKHQEIHDPAWHMTWQLKPSNQNNRSELHELSNNKKQHFSNKNHLAQDIDARNAPFCYFAFCQLGQLQSGEAPVPRSLNLARMPRTDWWFSNPRCRCICGSTWTNFSRLLDQQLQWYLWYLGETKPRRFKMKEKRRWLEKCWEW